MSQWKNHYRVAHLVESGLLLEFLPGVSCGWHEALQDMPHVGGAMDRRFLGQLCNLQPRPWRRLEIWLCQKKLKGFSLLLLLKKVHLTYSPATRDTGRSRSRKIREEEKLDDTRFNVQCAAYPGPGEVPIPCASLWPQVSGCLLLARGGYLPSCAQGDSGEVFLPCGTSFPGNTPCALSLLANIPMRRKCNNIRK